VQGRIQSQGFQVPRPPLQTSLALCEGVVGWKEARHLPEEAQKGYQEAAKAKQKGSKESPQES
jgi:hypothetical protein